MLAALPGGGAIVGNSRVCQHLEPPGLDQAGKWASKPAPQVLIGRRFRVDETPRGLQLTSASMRLEDAPASPLPADESRRELRPVVRQVELGQREEHRDDQ